MLEKKKEQVNVRFKKSELEEAEKAALKRGQLLSEFIRDAVRYFIQWLKEQKQ